MKMYVTFPAEDYEYGPTKNNLRQCGLKIYESRQEAWGDGTGLGGPEHEIEAYTFLCDASIIRWIRFCMVNKVRPIKNHMHDRLIIPMV